MGFVIVNGRLTRGRIGPPVAREEIKPAGIACVPREPLPASPGRFAGQCVAITSLSPNPARRPRLEKCLASWRDIGVPVIAVQAESEIGALPSESEWLRYVVSDKTATAYERPTQKISTLIQAGVKTGLPFLLINADIEITQHPTAIEAAILRAEELTIGVRYNHHAGESIKHATREPWGLDVFVMTPEMGKTVPDLPFEIGKPCWDYWLPHHFRSLGYKIGWLSEPLLFHERHPLGWSPTDWERGAAWLREHYGLALGRGTSEAYRLSLNEPM